MPSFNQKIVVGLTWKRETVWLLKEYIKESKGYLDHLKVAKKQKYFLLSSKVSEISVNPLFVNNTTLIVLLMFLNLIQCSKYPLRFSLLKKKLVL